ncbi:MAG: hypothetical protein ABIO44_03740 [Saprospiraceae bacterium]
MRFPWYKIWLSYLTDVTIEETASILNPKLIVYLSKGRIKLCTPNAIYSEADHYYNFTEIFENIKISNLKIPKTLVLGLGLGSIPFMLEKIFHVETEYKLIELDPIIIDLFNKYVKDDLSSPMNIILMDAFEFMTTNTQKYYLICVDIFIDRTTPIIFEQNEFLSKLKDALNETGIIIYNRLLENNKDKALNQSFDHLFNSFFPNRFIQKVKYNEMYVVINN